LGIPSRVRITAIWYESAFASQLSLKVNYYDIKVSNATVPTDAKLARFANLSDPLSCAAISRTPNGLISRINAQLQNIGGIATRGFDLTLVYRTRQPRTARSACRSTAIT
jgi:iron complex outermembrane receptor protein